MRDLTSKWTEFNYNEIPHSLELFQVFYDYVKSRYQILDIGTGTGYTAIKLGLQGYNVIGIDINKKGIEKITRNTVHGNISNLINFQISTATNLPFKSESFDFIIMQAFLTTIIEKENRNKIILSYIAIDTYEISPSPKKKVLFYLLINLLINLNILLTIILKKS